MKTPANFSVDHPRVVAAIGAAEKRTSGEIRVLVSRRPTADAVADAWRHFERLEMTRTRERNGVLFFVAPRSRAFAVIGDTNIHARCGDVFWREVAEAMSEHFRRGDFTGGLENGIARAGDLLAHEFPSRSDDQNELPDEVEED